MENIVNESKILLIMRFSIWHRCLYVLRSDLFLALSFVAASTKLILCFVGQILGPRMPVSLGVTLFVLASD